MNDLQSNPHFLISLLKLLICNDGREKQKLQTDLVNLQDAKTQLDSEQQTLNSCKDGKDALHSKSAAKCDKLETKSNEHVRDEPIKTDVTKRAMNKCHDGLSKVESQNQQKAKKRKSKYSDIEGDLSHIYRDPKYPKIARHKQRKNHKRKTEKQNRAATTEVPETTTAIPETEPNEDVILVRKLMKMLVQPKSRTQQECIIGLLKSDNNLRQIFLDERAKVGKVTIPVIRQTKAYLAHEDWSEHARCANSNDVAENTTDKDEGESKEQTLEDEALTNFLISVLKSSQRDKCHALETFISKPQTESFANNATEGFDKSDEKLDHQTDITTPRAGSFSNIYDAVDNVDFTTTLGMGLNTMYTATHEEDLDGHLQQLTHDLYQINNLV